MKYYNNGLTAGFWENIIRKLQCCFYCAKTLEDPLPSEPSKVDFRNSTVDESYMMICSLICRPILLIGLLSMYGLVSRYGGRFVLFGLGPCQAKIALSPKFGELRHFLER